VGRGGAVDERCRLVVECDAGHVKRGCCEGQGSCEATIIEPWVRSVVTNGSRVPHEDVG